MELEPTGTGSGHADEVARGERFKFGENWRSFLRTLNAERIAEAERGLTRLLARTSLAGKSFLDVGSGSGLSSLAARRLGARVVSFDYDPESVECTRAVRQRFFPDDAAWQVMPGSALDPGFLESLGRFDIVYSWGVLHHTGAMWKAVELIADRVASGGSLALALYNDQGAWSRRWLRIKRFYCSGPLGRVLVSASVIPYWVLRRLAADLVWRRNPFAHYRDYHKRRGMSVTHDWFDWLGGYPFEVAKPEAVLDVLIQRGFSLQGLFTCGGSLGCNEYRFVMAGSRT
jgi:2-polyprenyl-6-hydroxyphenyl methylase/3-demethylubiquinone-9 3-methyltransferase